MRSWLVIWTPEMCFLFGPLFDQHGFQFVASHLLVEDSFCGIRRNNGEFGLAIEKKKPITPRTKLTKWKTMLLLSSTCSPKQESVKLLPQGDTSDSKVMVDYLKDTRKRFGSLRSDKTSFRDLFLMWDNANPHTSKETRKFLKTSKVDLANQSPYSHDLCDRSLFRKLKSLMKNQSFYDPEDILQAV